MDDGELIDMYPGYHTFRVDAADDNGDPFWLTYNYEVGDATGASVNDGGSGGGGGGGGGDENGRNGGESGGSGDGSGGNGTDTGGGGGVIYMVTDRIGDTTNNIVHNAGDITTKVVRRVSYVGDSGVDTVTDTVKDIGQGRLPDTGGGWTVLLFSGSALVGGGWFLVRRFSR